MSLDLALTSFIFLGPLLAAPPAQPAAPAPEPARMLSEVLPDTVAAFVKHTGADRPVSELPPGAVDNLYADEPDAEMLLETLRPQNHMGLGKNEVTLAPVPTTDEAPAVPESGAYLLVAAMTVLLKDGTELAVGDQLALGDTVVEGFVLNAGSRPVLLETLDGQYTLFPGESFALSNNDCVSCDVEVGPGYYACCRTNAKGCCECVSRANGDSPKPCSSGGPGAIKCSCIHAATQFIGP